MRSDNTWEGLHLGWKPVIQEIWLFDWIWAVCGRPSFGKGFLALSFPLVEAAMCSAFDCGFDMRRWP